jgi:predicted Rossmann fold flavoprotein
MEKIDVLILGAGAAGLMCALRAGQRGRKVALIDHAAEAGAKILVSGGGRCNFTNRIIAPDRYISNNPHFCRSALAAFTPNHFIALVEKHKIPYHKKTLGQLFCDRSAKDILAMLLSECEAAHVDMRLNQHVLSLDKPDAFRVKTEKETYEAPALVLATGGLSMPKMGASDFTHRTAKHFGLPLTDMRPALEERGQGLRKFPFLF